MYLVNPDTKFKFGIKKIEGKFIPVQIKDDSEIKEGQILFEAKAFSAKEIVVFNSLEPVDQFEFVKNRMTCNLPMDNMIPTIINSINYYLLGLSVMNEEDSKLFM